jgi:hypothetical protein
MHPRGLSTALFLAMIVLIAGLLVGCGGGDQSGSGSQQDGGSKAKQGENAQEQQGKNAPKKAKNASKKKILFGIVKFVNPKTEGFSVRPTVDEQGKKPIVFRLANKFKITLGGKEAKMEDMKKGQQAQVEYVVRNDRNRALSVKLFEGGAPDDQGGEKTG